jgi:hypothetical protein
MSITIFVYFIDDGVSITKFGALVINFRGVASLLATHESSLEDEK